MSTDPRRGLTRGGPNFNKVVAERIVAGQAAAEKNSTGMNANSPANLEQQPSNNGYFLWKLSQRQTKEQRNNPAKYDAEFRKRYENYLAKRGGTRRKHGRKNKKTYRKRR